MLAFIRKQNIFPTDAPTREVNELSEKDLKAALMAQGIEKRSRVAMIENK